MRRRFADAGSAPAPVGETGQTAALYGVIQSVLGCCSASHHQEKSGEALARCCPWIRREHKHSLSPMKAEDQAVIEQIDSLYVRLAT